MYLFKVPPVEEEKQTPFQSQLQANDVTYSLRHVEESWIHLLKAGGQLQLFNVSLMAKYIPPLLFVLHRICTLKKIKSSKNLF